MRFKTKGGTIIEFTDYEPGFGYDCYINGEWYGEGYSRMAADDMIRRYKAVYIDAEKAKRR